MSDYATQIDYRPTWPLSVYLDWLHRNLGTPEQQKRYRAAVEWYRAQQEKLREEK